MRVRSSVYFVLALAVLIGALGFWGCAKTPVVTGAGPTIASPGPGTAPGTAGPSDAPRGAGPSAGEISVARPVSPTETPIVSSPGVSGSALPGGGAAAAGMSPLKDVFFEYEKAAIDASQRTALDDNVRWLKANGNARILVEGHCDERGSAEYNLGLGDRRAKAVRDYLLTSGIAANRIGTISYGKERPFVFGHDENAWKQNRRVHFTLQGK
ncbi:MAG: Outer rane lipoprotein omp16 precursor (peptidoglycan-associated lipoprotein) (modular protein) [candidate division NC10 bacterium]|nr:Outer rane lipoprotein omp16 precursor (peptidoglycan-associated lipoprotein) (modular protein) [candidate division NC10 bacterium]